ncbi:MAG: hypothetical protein M1834_001252 [Cirrosporium novae-zelandiae]|nr:MAG: hypothetical protein M1834_001252 [Cirrosporium novae-zelandiae]
MRLIAIFPLLCAVAAFILSMLCLFAGSKRNFIENGDLLTLNVSMLGHVSSNSSNSSSDGLLSSITSAIGDAITDEINDVVDDITAELGIHDFYSAHLLDYCEGYFEPNATVKDSHKNVTKCSNTTAFYHFDPSDILSSELTSGINLTDLDWPDDIDDKIQDVKTASKALFVLYCIGIAAAGISVLASIAAVIIDGRLIAFVNFILALIAFLGLGIASAIVTVVVVKVVDAVNKYGDDISISATKGNKFLGMTWAATALMLIAAMGWVLDCCAGRKKRKTYVRDGKEGRL